VCCVVGSVLFIAVAWCTRTFKTRVLGQQPATPERWRLAVPDLSDEAVRDAPGGGADVRSPGGAGAILDDRGGGLVGAR
jgi:hypothetical protein